MATITIQKILLVRGGWGGGATPSCRHVRSSYRSAILSSLQCLVPGRVHYGCSRVLLRALPHKRMRYAHAPRERESSTSAHEKCHTTRVSLPWPLRRCRPGWSAKKDTEPLCGLLPMHPWRYYYHSNNSNYARTFS